MRDANAMMKRQTVNRTAQPCRVSVRTAVSLLCGLLLLFVGAPAAPAANITWSEQALDANGDVSRLGETVEASFFVGDNPADITSATAPVSGPLNVNGVTFTQTNFSSGGSLSNLSGLTYDTGEFGHTEATGGFGALIDGIGLESGTGSQNAMLTGLEVGREYLVEFYYYHNKVDRSLTVDDGNTNTVTLNDNNNSGIGRVATGVFTADATTQTVNFTASEGSQFTNGYQLRTTSDSALNINFDDADGPLGGSVPFDYRTYTGQGTTVQFTSGIGSDGDVGVNVATPFFRNTNDSGYGDVTALDPSGDPTTGYNTVMNSGALVNDTSQTITVELTDLNAGRYSIRFFLHNIFSSTTDNNPQGLWDISGDGGVIEDVLATFGFNDPINGTEGIPPTDLDSIGQILLEFEVLSDGDSASFTFTPDTLAANGQLWVNGFELAVIPNPMALPAGLVLLALSAMRRRR